MAGDGTLSGGAKARKQKREIHRKNPEKDFNLIHDAHLI